MLGDLLIFNPANSRLIFLLLEVNLLFIEDAPASESVIFRAILAEAEEIVLEEQDEA
jgi:hypothetical protein